MKLSNYILIFLFLLFGKSNPKFLDKNKLYIEDDIIATINTDNETELREAINILNIMGGIVYINTSIISFDIDSTIELTGPTAGGIIGLKQSNDEYPRLDFKKVRDK